MPYRQSSPTICINEIHVLNPSLQLLPDVIRSQHLHFVAHREQFLDEVVCRHQPQFKHGEVALLLSGASTCGSFMTYYFIFLENVRDIVGFLFTYSYLCNWNEKDIVDMWTADGCRTAGGRRMAAGVER